MNEEMKVNEYCYKTGFLDVIPYYKGGLREVLTWLHTTAHNPTTVPSLADTPSNTLIYVWKFSTDQTVFKIINAQYKMITYLKSNTKKKFF